MERTLIKSILVFLVTCGYVSDCLSLEYSPAKFGKYETVYLDRLSFPDGFESGVVLIRCAADVSKWGGFKTNFCYHDDKSNIPFVRMVQNALVLGKVEPAKVGGKKVGVWFQYSVRFEKKGNIDEISIHPHHFWNESELGRDYISPQSYGSYRYWKGCRRSLNIVSEAEVSVDGKAVPKTIIGENNSEYCKEMVSALISEGSYVPGFYMRQPRKMRLIEIFFSGDVVER